MCMPVRVKNVPPNWGTLGAQGFVKGVKPSPISPVHSLACNTINAVPKNIVARSHTRVFFRSATLAARTASTMVTELESRHPVIIVALMMLDLPKGVGQFGVEMRP